MTDEERVTVCQQEIRRLRGIVREQAAEIQEMKKLFWSMVRGFSGSDDYSPEMLYSILIAGGADQYQHELLTEMIAEEVLEE